MPHILVIDDEPAICWGLEQLLTDNGHVVATAGSAEAALECVAEQTPDAIVLDVRLPGMDGLSAIPQLRAETNDAPIVVMTAHGNLETAVQAVKQGAFDYLPKPFDLDKASDAIERALSSRGNSARVATADSRPVLDNSLVGASPPMHEVFKQIALVAASDVPVLITGESGTGKEMAARAIHANGHRAEKPFLPICLAALSAGLVESELFGHVKGAFTGASQNRVGLLELAAGGTVLLDEIAETEPGLQVKLLRALEQREVTPVGDATPRAIDARIIAATNKSLPEFIQSGRFRDDLYFRLSVFRIHLPPLRERNEDIPALANHFLRLARTGDAPVEFSVDALAELQRRNWPGNVRELRNAVEHAAVLSRGGTILAEHLPAPEISLAATSSAGKNPSEEIAERLTGWVTGELKGADVEELYDRFLDLCEPPVLRAVLEHCKDHKTRAAELLGMHRTTLRQKLRKHGLEHG